MSNPPPTPEEQGVIAAFFRVQTYGGQGRAVTLRPPRGAFTASAWAVLANLRADLWPLPREEEGEEDAALEIEFDVRVSHAEFAGAPLAAVVAKAATLRRRQTARSVPIRLYLGGLAHVPTQSILDDLMNSPTEKLPRFVLVQVVEPAQLCGLGEARLFAKFALSARWCREDMRLDFCFGTAAAPESANDDECARVLAAAQAAQAGCNLVLHANYWSARGWTLWFGAAHGFPTEFLQSYTHHIDEDYYAEVVAPLDACLRSELDDGDGDHIVVDGDHIVVDDNAALPRAAVAFAAADGAAPQALRIDNADDLMAFAAAAERDAAARAAGQAAEQAAERPRAWRLPTLLYLRMQIAEGDHFHGVLAFCSNLRVLHVTQGSDLRGADLAAAFAALPRLEVLVCAARMDRAALPALAALAARPALGVLNVLPAPVEDRGHDEPDEDEWDAAGAAWVRARARASAGLPLAAVMVWKSGGGGKWERGESTRRAMEDYVWGYLNRSAGGALPAVTW